MRRLKRALGLLISFAGAGLAGYAGVELVRVLTGI